MATQAQIEANRINSQHSTGPRTEGGKARSSLNGLKHGMCSSAPVLPWEKQDDWLEFLDTYIQDLSPEGPTQFHCVEQVALAARRMARVPHLEYADASWSGEQLVASGENCSSVAPQPDSEPWRDEAILKDMKTFAQSTSLNLVMRYETHLSRQMTRFLDLLRKLKQDKIKAEERA